MKERKIEKIAPTKEIVGSVINNTFLSLSLICLNVSKAYPSAALHGTAHPFPLNNCTAKFSLIPTGNFLGFLGNMNSGVTI